MPVETEKSGERMPSTGGPSALLFINTTHPRDATTRGSLKQIRSHAARVMRSRTRRPCNAVAPLGKKDKSSNLKQPGQDANSEQGDVPARVDLSLREDEDARLTRYILASLSMSGPHQDIGISPLAPVWSPVRPLSDKENFLLDHYLNYIIPFNNGSCHRNRAGLGEELVAIQLKYWVPFALSDPGLLSALFLQSCHSLGTLGPCQNYVDMSTEYRLQCIRSTNASLSIPGSQSSDATIAKVMIMAADEFAHGNFAGWSAHLAAITRMIEMRGGVDALGVGGFLKEIIVNTPICYGY
ncbi:hypothetical protein GQ53DRAFT_7428 [Thozetella sp. PMI_491]|nr:hypothetical protein GQ53DRAFT_7428 [Thozetella sp. PMI_491]